MSLGNLSRYKSCVRGILHASLVSHAGRHGFQRGYRRVAKAYAKYLTKNKNMSINEIIEKTGVSRATIFRLKKKNSSETSLRDTTNKRTNGGGRPRKLDSRDEGKLIRTLKQLRKGEGSSPQSD